MTNHEGGDDDRDGADGDRDGTNDERTASDAGRGGPKCQLCYTPLFGRHCKYVCPQHGVVIDCSDPFL